MSDSATPSVTPEELDQLLQAAASSDGDPVIVKRFTDALLDSTVGWIVGQAEGSGPVSVSGEDGSPHVPFFSSPSTLEQAVHTFERDDIRGVGLSCRELFSMAVRNQVPTVLNPFSPVGKGFTVPEMSDLLAGIVPGTQTRHVDRDTTLLVGTPAHVPPQLVAGLTEYLRELGPEISAAALAWVRYPDGLEGFLLEVVTDLPRERVTDDIDRAAAHTDGHTLDVVVRTVAEGFGLASGVEPFWPVTA